MATQSKRTKNKKKEAEPIVIELELPSVPNFPYMSRKDTPPVGAVLILETVEGGFIFGEWDGHQFIDSSYSLVDSVYGKVAKWCILLDSSGEFVSTKEGD
jgi:hypothetical protein